jgi:hypothetical protein
MSRQKQVGYPPLGITADSTDAVLKGLTDAMCYRAAVGLHPFVFASLVAMRRVLQLEREVQTLQKAPPHLRGVEKR